MLKDALTLAQHNTHLTIDTHTNTHTAIHTTASLVYSSHPLHTPHPKLSSEFPSGPKIDLWGEGEGWRGARHCVVGGKLCQELGCPVLVLLFPALRKKR